MCQIVTGVTPQGRPPFYEGDQDLQCRSCHPVFTERPIRGLFADCILCKTI